MMVLVLQLPSSWEYSRGLSIQVCRHLDAELLWMRHCCWAFHVLVAIVLCDRIGPSLGSVLKSCFDIATSRLETLQLDFFDYCCCCQCI
jgi:hypothetical protein